LAQSAAGVILVHNHPSGNPCPSPEDPTVTGQFIRTCGLVSIQVVDHIIIGDRGYYSFAEERELSVAMVFSGK